MANKEYRDSLISFKIDNDLSAQIYALREQRGLTQEELGALARMAQPRIAKLEASCEGVSSATLKRLASAFDVGLVIRFAPHSECVADSVRVSVDRSIPAFPDDLAPAESFHVVIKPITDGPYLRRTNLGASRQLLRSPISSSNRSFVTEHARG